MASKSIAPGDVREGRLSLPPAANDPELKRRWIEDGWPQEARYERILSAIGLVGVVLGWFVDYQAMGVSSSSLVLLGARALTGLSALPLLIATFAFRPPAWLVRAKLLFVGGFPALLIVVLTLHPTHVNSQGWAMVVTWALLHTCILAPLKPKLALGALTFALYGAHLFYLNGKLHGAYGTTSEMLAVLACAVPVIAGLPWLPHRMEQRRLRELVTRVELEREVALRTEQQRALEIAKEAAESAVREAKEQKARADASAEEARTAVRKAEQEGKLRSQLFANMSHDLRTPMAGILGLVDLMRATKLTEEQSGYVETIRASNQTLLALLNDVIDFARIDEGKLPLTAVPVSLDETMRSPAALLRVSAERKGLLLRVDLAEDLPRFVKLDPVRVQQILLNLLGNALKFTEAGSVTLRVSTTRWVDRRGWLRVEVEDTGIGFSAEQRARLFQRFRQAEDTTSQRFGGSGLGLSICSGLVSLMSGTLGAESEPGKGARFWFELPVEETVAPSDRDSLAEVPEMKTLLAEDNPVNQMVISLMLKKLRQGVSVASDGKQALRMLTDQRFDLAIMDMQMPLLDGDEVTRRLRMLSGSASMTYIIALTASVTAEQRDKYSAAGVDAIYTKPIDMDGLRYMLAKEGPRAMARRNASRAANRI